jgi:anaerobic ribonucleoside-triphosphate reductase activating protein
MHLNIHSLLWKSKANGPGTRSVVWFQGCSVQCPGCFNPLTHSFQPNQLIEPSELAKEIVFQSKETEGITISGGEPFDQLAGLLIFLQAIRSLSQLSVILFSGYSFDKISKMPQSIEIMQNVDVLIAGPFDKTRLQQKNLAGSSNKTYHFFTDKYSLKDFETIPEAEIVIDSQGNITFSGIQFLG